MPKIKSISNAHPIENTFMFHCPGCNEAHGFAVPPHAYNGDAQLPTVRPSIIIGSGGTTKYRCHSVITNGKISFLTDTTHKLRNRTVDLDDL